MTASRAVTGRNVIYVSQQLQCTSAGLSCSCAWQYSTRFTCSHVSKSVMQACEYTFPFVTGKFQWRHDEAVILVPVPCGQVSRLLRGCNASVQVVAQPPGQLHDRPYLHGRQCKFPRPGRRGICIHCHANYRVVMQIPGLSCKTPRCVMQITIW